MQEKQSELIDVSQLRTGMFVELELGWMSHPFPTGSFKISSEKQIETIRGLGLTRVRYVPAKSDPAVSGSADSGTSSTPAAAPAAQGDLVRAQAGTEEERRRKERAALIAAQQRSLLACEQRFGETLRLYKHVVDQVVAKPQESRDQCLGLINGFVTEMSCDGESAIRLLSEGMGERANMHPVNVTVLSLLLGRAMGLPPADLVDLGAAAFLHDVGKSELPERVHWLEENFSIAEYKLYQEHVRQSVAIANSMQLSEGALMAIAQHHELVDGSGFPARVKGDQQTLPAKIVALIDRYENLCNPIRPSAAITPHEALALLFAQLKTRYDSVVMSAFIRMMGVYPPGSVIQLVDERYAIVVSVNTSRPLKPRVIVHDPSVPKHEALILDLERAPEVGIRRSLKPSSLPREVLDYLAPRQRVGYFFEKAGGSVFSGPATPDRK